MRKRTEVAPDTFSRLLQQQFATECVREYRFHPMRRWRFDYALPAFRVAVEIEGGVWTGGRHTSSVGFLKDIEKYNTATAMGWSLLRFASGDQFSTHALSIIQTTITTKTNIARNETD